MNKKYILVLALILVIVAGGVLYFWYKQQPPQVNIQNNTTYSQASNSNASIITNKNEYSKGEIVKIVIQNNTDLEKNILSPFYIIEGFDKESWVEIKKILCPCDSVCKLVAYFRLESKKTRDFEWNQKEEWCTDERRTLSETISKQVPSGIYRIKIEIVNSSESYPYQSKETIYSERFLIR